MQINGYGSHSVNSHEVTKCIHNHESDKKMGGVKMSAQPSKQNQTQINTTLSDVQSEGFGLTAWLQKMRSASKGIWLRIWGDNSGEITDVKAEMTDGEDLIHVPYVTEERKVRDSAPAEQVGNPYFVPMDDTVKAQPDTMWQKMRLVVKDITKHLQKQFSGKSSFQMKQEQPKEDMRKHSRYRKDELEINCILTDDSYLMDSYDRKGEYSKLSTKQ